MFKPAGLPLAIQPTILGREKYCATNIAHSGFNLKVETKPSQRRVFGEDCRKTKQCISAILCLIIQNGLARTDI